MVAKDHVPTTAEVLSTHLSVLVALATAWVVMDGVAMVSINIILAIYN